MWRNCVSAVSLQLENKVQAPQVQRKHTPSFPVVMKVAV